MHASPRLSLVGVTLALCAALLGGCQQTLIPTPYVMYGDAGRAVFEQTPTELRTGDAPVIFVTDRALEAPTVSMTGDPIADRGPQFGSDRSLEMTYGVVTVEMGKNLDWDTLVRDSTGKARSRSYHPRVVRVEPKGNFGNVMKFYEPFEGRLRARPEALEEHRAELAGLHDLITQWLARSPRKEVGVFVHGFNNTFDDAAIRTAQAWHMFGRVGVPIVYTWPAGAGGITGYAYDRESGEFTVVHLKLLLLALAAHPDVEKVHLISHSRGTDVATTAVRELHAEIRGAMHTSLLSAQLGDPPANPRMTYEVLKLETFVLAAPDMDLDVFIQRFFGENLYRAANRVVIYFSRRDEAIGLADWLFRSRRRIGAMRLSDFKPEGLALIDATPAIELIDCDTTGSNTHAYLVQHPAALSDLILLLRNDAPPGDPRRPLVRAEKGIWQLDNNYLKPDAKSAE